MSALQEWLFWMLFFVAIAIGAGGILFFVWVTSLGGVWVFVGFVALLFWLATVSFLFTTKAP